METYKDKTAAGPSYDSGNSIKPAVPTITGDLGILLARTEANEYTVARIWTRLFGSQPTSPDSACCPESAAGDIIEMDVARINRSASRTRDMLEQLEVRLG